MYPPSLVKSVLGDYGIPGCDHESNAIKQYVLTSGCTVKECGVFLSKEFPYLATSPDGVISIDSERFGVIEVKCPFKHCKNSIEEACKDTAFCLITFDDGQTILNRKHDYYYQVTGQLCTNRC